MNSLSWFLYLSDVASTFKELCQIMLIITAICAVFGIIFLPMALNLMDVRDFTWVRPTIKGVIIGYGIFIALYLITPSKSTMYAIAASQMGEQLSQNKEVQGISNDAVKALHQWIKRQIEPDKKS